MNNTLKALELLLMDLRKVGSTPLPASWALDRTEQVMRIAAEESRRTTACIENAAKAITLCSDTYATLSDQVDLARTRIRHEFEVDDEGSDPPRRDSGINRGYTLGLNFALSVLAGIKP